MIKTHEAEYAEFMRPQLEDERGWTWWCDQHDAYGLEPDKEEAEKAAAHHVSLECDPDEEDERLCCFVITPPKKG